MSGHSTDRNRGVVATFVADIQARGRAGFSLNILVDATSLSRPAASAQLRRLSDVVQLHARSNFFLVVDPLHRFAGAPPVEWWIDDFFADSEPYYIGLLSAAALHGSSPQAIMVTQVVTERYRQPIRIGRRRIQFTSKVNAGKTPVMTPRGARVAVKVSTPEATFLDLVRFQTKLGGWPRALDVIDGLTLTPKGLKVALEPSLEAKQLQRAEFILELAGRKQLAHMIDVKLRGVRPKPAEILMSTNRWALPIDPNAWNVVGTLGPRSGA